MNLPNEIIPNKKISTIHGSVNIQSSHGLYGNFSPPISEQLEIDLNLSMSMYISA